MYERRFGAIFEDTTPNIPQQNGWVEHKFATLFGRVCLVLNGENFTCIGEKCCRVRQPILQLYWKIMIWRFFDGMSALQQFLGRAKRETSSLLCKNWQQMHCHEQWKNQSKDDNLAKSCIWLNYADNYVMNIYHVISLKTQNLILICNVVFIKKPYFIDEEMNRATLKY